MTSKKTAVNDVLLYFPDHRLYMNYKVFVLLAVIVAMITAAGCTGLSAGSVSSPGASSQIAQIATSNNRLMTEDKAGWAASGAPVAIPVPTSAPTAGDITGSGPIDTKIIKTAELTLEVKDVTGTVDALKAVATAQGGYLSSTNVQKDYNNQLTGTVTIRIPEAGFENAIAGAKALGTVKSISTSGEDVTEEYVDLQAQKTSYTNQLAQYNVIMKQSTKVEDIITVQEQIDQVQTELDRLNGRLNYLNNRIDLSTITVSLQEPEPVGGQTGHDFVATLNAGIAGFFGMVDAIIVLLLTVLPLIILGAVGYGIYRWKKGKNPAQPAMDKKENP
jgi:Domain of unknown function (DUF4349)